MLVGRQVAQLDLSRDLLLMLYGLQGQRELPVEQPRWTIIIHCHLFDLNLRVGEFALQTSEIEALIGI